MNIDVIKRRVLASRPKAKLLLDQFPNAAAAYSLRLLNSQYTGDCIEVRRSSDNTTQNIGFVDGVLDTTSLLSFVGSGNGFVRTWYDQSGNSGRNGVNTNTLRQPQIVNSGSLITEGGKPSLLFNGSSHNLLINNFQTENYTSISILAVYKATITTGLISIFSKFRSSPLNQRSFIYGFRDGRISSNLSEFGVVNLRVQSSSITIDDYQLSSMVFRGDQNGSNIDKVDYFKNGIITDKILETDNTVTSLFNPDTAFVIGAAGDGISNFFAGTISEVIFYEFSQFDNIPTMHNLSNQYYNIF